MNVTAGSRSAWLAAGLSLILPGLGQLYNGERAKGIAVLCMTLGIWFALLTSGSGQGGFRSSVTVVLLGFLYLFIWLPAVMDAYQAASRRCVPLLSGASAWYVVMMLLSVGPMAVPLLWQSPAFSRRWKIVWTAVVILTALSAVVLTALLGAVVQQFLRDNPDLLQVYPELRGLVP
jgi:TM2 domain-containing membrane protein YozV